MPALRIWRRGSPLLLLMIALLGGCQGYRNEQSRTPGEFADDVYIQAAVKTALVRDSDISGINLNVEVRKGIVTLFGGVPNETVRAKAVDISAKVSGVKQVEDKLTVVGQ